MYRQSDWQENREQLKRRLITLSIPVALFVAGIVVSLVFRMEWLTTLLTVLCGALIIFCYSMFIAPVASYGRHLRSVLTGRTRETAGRVKEISAQAAMREGVSYYPMLVNVGDMADEADDRLFYYDVQKGKPPFEPGDMVTVVSHDKAVADIRGA